MPPPQQLAPPDSPPLKDTLSRPMTDLRISVTDRCNFRCTFCMPAEQKYEFLPKPQILSFEEIERLVKIFVGLGVRKLRLTGGEPLLRSQIAHLVERLAKIDGIDDLALTTNGWLLAQQAEGLAAAGLNRVTVSFHSLDPEIFGRLSGLGMDLNRVFQGLRAATRAGLGPVKLNVVAVRGTNEHEIVDLARFAREAGYVLRFIEYMDVGTVNRWDPQAVISARQIVEQIDAVLPLEAIDREHPGDVATRYRYLDGGGEIGVIPSVTQPFCGNCSRVRLSAEGTLYTCLFAAGGQDLKQPLRAGASDEELAERIAGIWGSRSDRYSEKRTAQLKAGRFVPAAKVEMFRIGG